MNGKRGSKGVIWKDEKNGFSATEVEDVISMLCSGLQSLTLHTEHSQELSQTTQVAQ